MSGNYPTVPAFPRDAGGNRAARAFVVLVLLAALIVRSLIPPGYMPAAQSHPHTALFELCGGDWRSGQILQSLAHGHNLHSQGHHAQIDHRDHSFVPEFCLFGALTAPPLPPWLATDFPSLARSLPLLLPDMAAQYLSHFPRHGHSRAPPQRLHAV